MDHPLVIVALTVVGVILLKLGLDFVLSGGDLNATSSCRAAPACASCATRSSPPRSMP